MSNTLVVLYFPSWKYSSWGKRLLLSKKEEEEEENHRMAVRK